MHIRVVCVGRTRNSSIKALAVDYLGRIRHFAGCDVLETRESSKAHRLSRAARLASEAADIKRVLPRSGFSVGMDEDGREFSSLEFARWLEAEQDRGTRELSFVIGGPEGLDPGLLAGCRMRLALGRMTWTHEMCRVLLLEQIYRSFCIIRNVPYHK